MTYSIRFCGPHEKEKLVDFLRDSWRSDHPFVSDPELLDWQYLQEGRYNFVVANHIDSDKFHGVLGFISPGFFSQGWIGSGEDIWLSIWKVNKELAEKNTIGLELLQFVRSHFLPNSVSAIGINSEVAKLYRVMGCKVGSLRQFFILNSGLLEFEIAHIEQDGGPRVPPQPSEVRKSDPLRINEVEERDLHKFSSILASSSSSKDINYVLGRFTRHPSYTYRFFSVEQERKPVSLFVARNLRIDQASCFRIVDFFGIQSVRSSLGHQFQKLLSAEGAEYIDLMVSGIADHVIQQIGFVECSEKNFVPHLFEPFVREISTVQFAVFDKRDLVIFKGDSDLDRPN